MTAQPGTGNVDRDRDKRDPFDDGVDDHLDERAGTPKITSGELHRLQVKVWRQLYKRPVPPDLDVRQLPESDRWEFWIYDVPLDDLLAPDFDTADLATKIEALDKMNREREHRALVVEEAETTIRYARFQARYERAQRERDGLQERLKRERHLLASQQRALEAGKGIDQLTRAQRRKAAIFTLYCDSGCTLGEIFAVPDPRMGPNDESLLLLVRNDGRGPAVRWLAAALTESRKPGLLIECKHGSGRFPSDAAFAPDRLSRIRRAVHDVPELTVWRTRRSA